MEEAPAARLHQVLRAELPEAAPRLARAGGPRHGRLHSRPPDTGKGANPPAPHACPTRGPDPRPRGWRNTPGPSAASGAFRLVSTWPRGFRDRRQTRWCAANARTHPSAIGTRAVFGTALLRALRPRLALHRGRLLRARRLRLPLRDDPRLTRQFAPSSFRKYAKPPKADGARGLDAPAGRVPQGEKAIRVDGFEAAAHLEMQEGRIALADLRHRLAPGDALPARDRDVADIGIDRQAARHRGGSRGSAPGRCPG